MLKQVDIVQTKPPSTKQKMYNTVHTRVRRFHSFETDTNPLIFEVNMSVNNIGGPIYRTTLTERIKQRTGQSKSSFLIAALFAGFSV